MQSRGLEARGRADEGVFLPRHALVSFLGVFGKRRRLLQISQRLPAQCPSCGNQEYFYRNGLDRHGNPRLRCMACNRTFGLVSTPRAVRPSSGQACPRCGTLNTRRDNAVDHQRQGFARYVCRPCKCAWYLPLATLVPPKAPEWDCQGGGPCYWVIDEPLGPTSMGACRTCGSTREFKNYLVIRKDALTIQRA